MLDWENIISFDLVQLKADIFGKDTLVWLGALRAKKKEKEDRMWERSNEGNVRGVAGGFRSLSLFPFALVFRSSRFFLCSRAWLTRQM